MPAPAVRTYINVKLRTLLMLLWLSAGIQINADVWDEVDHGFVDSDGVKIHYATTGSGPLVVMVHGFPDFWYTWHHQMDALKGDFKLVAIDQRGYNLSDKPAGDENYDMRLLMADLAAVIRHFNQEQATVIGHDWGGIVSWQFALNYPQMVNKLIILNLPHPNGMAREMAINPE
jgi:epoxide hydrolase 4